MKLGLPWLTQVQGNVDPSIDSPNSLGGWVAQTLKVLVASITAGYHTEHNDDDTHKTIHASGSISERLRTTPMGVWIPIPYSSVTFTMPGGTWSMPAASVLTLRYMLIGTTLTIAWDLITSTVVAPLSTDLVMSFTLNFQGSNTTPFAATHHYRDNGVSGVGVAVSAFTATGFSITLENFAIANWTASAANTNTRGQMSLEIQ